MSNKTDKVSPYTFIKNNNQYKQSRFEFGDKSGVIDCTLTTKTPLVIPDPETKRIINIKEKNKNIFEDKEHKEFDFYRIGGDCAIPGSSIRGCIRNIYEVVTDSCISSYNSEEFEKHIKNHCVDRDKLCDGCQLFGMIGNESLGSRIRVTDAYIMDQNPELNVITLKTLMGPEAKKCVKNDDIKGRKFYWHHPNITVSDYSDNGKKRSTNTTVEVLGEDYKFGFKIFFDKITKNELAKLLWCLTFGEKNNKKYFHKIGHGKPLGLGSVKIDVNEIHIKKNNYEKADYSIVSRGALLEYELDEQLLIEERKKDILKISDFEIQEGNKISY